MRLLINIRNQDTISRAELEREIWERRIASYDQIVEPSYAQG